MKTNRLSLLFIILASALLILPASSQGFREKDLNENLKTYIGGIVTNFHSIPDERKEKLKELADYIRSVQMNGDTVQLIFICTHNSRRSHFSQIWAQTAAHYYGVPNVYCYSGGTEATACNIRTVKALRKAGFSISAQDSLTSNPHYLVKYSTSAREMEAFSKKYDAQTNPQQKFAAIMTCSQADQACPLVFGADVRIAIPYEDPKVSDGTPHEEDVYNERCKQIATEMFFVFHSLKLQ